MNGYSNGGRLIPGWTAAANTSGEADPVVPYTGLFLEPDIESAEEEGDE